MSLHHLGNPTRRRYAAGAVFLALAATGCGSGTSGGGTAAPSAAPTSVAAASSTAPDRTQALCSAWADSDAAGANVLLHADLASATPDQLQAIVKKFWSTEEPILASIDQQAPDQIKADVGKLLALARHGASTGDSTTFTSPDLIGPDHNIDQYMLEQCGYQQVQVTAIDNAYQGIPSTVGAGTVGITLKNQGKDVHQVVISRANDGVTQPFTDILKLPPEQQLQMATPLGFTESEPGQTSTTFVRLTPGRYGAVDFLPNGTTSLAAPGGGAPHYSLGMVGEFTVT